MKEGGSLIVIFLLICIETISSLDYENMCQHQFSQGCPVHDGASWNCAKVLTNCSSDRYHCVLNSTGQPFNVTHTCVPLIECVKGTIPIYDERKKAISCKPCREGYYQPRDAWSDETPECLERHTCEEEGHKIECDAGTGSSNTQDVYCRCDARKGYILTNFENREKCVEWAHATCYFSPCPDGQERLLNYSCAPLCPLGQKRDDNDICIPISLVIQTTSSSNDSSTVSGETTPKTTTATTTPTSTSMPTAIDSNIPTIIAIVMSGFVLIILGVLLILCSHLIEATKGMEQFTVFRRWYLSKQNQREQNQIEQNQSDQNQSDQNQSVMNPGRTRRQKPTDPRTESEEKAINQETGANAAAGNNSSKRARTNKGKAVVYQKIYVNADVAQIGKKNKLTKYNVSAMHQETSDDSSSNVSRRSSDSDLTDLPHLPNSSQGELPVNRNLSSQRNSSEDRTLS